MKRIAITLLALLMLTACQPTPDHDAVKQKDTNVLIDTVISEQKQPEAENSPVPVKMRFPERFECDFYTSASNVHVTADVPIRVKTDGRAFPFARVEHRYLSNAERLAIYRRLFQKDELYIWQRRPRTREDVAGMIQLCMDALDYTPEERAEWMRDTDSTAEEWEEMLERNREQLAELQREYNSLPETVTIEPNKPWDGSVPEAAAGKNDWNYIEVVGGADVQSDTWQYDHANIAEFKTESNIWFSRAIKEEDFATGTNAFYAYSKSSVRIDPSDYDARQEGASLSAREAADLAKAVLGDVAPDYDIADIYWTNNAYSDGDTKGSFNTWGYLVILTPKVQGATMIYVANAASDSGDDFSVNRSWPYDSVNVSVDSSGSIMDFSWGGALNITETLSETSPLLPFETVAEFVEQQLNYAWNGSEEYQNGSIVIDDVQLGLFRIRERNDMDHGLLVPVWFFTGTFYYAPEYVEYGITQRRFDMMNPLLIVNAIDGTIINAYTGY